MALALELVIKSLAGLATITFFYRTSTLALTNSTLAYCLKIANMGWKDAVRSDVHLANGVNVCEGKVTYKAVADALGYEYTALAGLLG